MLDSGNDEAIRPRAAEGSLVLVLVVVVQWPKVVHWSLVPSSRGRQGLQDAGEGSVVPSSGTAVVTR